jgi:hypothetical protein
VSWIQKLTRTFGFEKVETAAEQTLVKKRRAMATSPSSVLLE